MKFAKNKQRFPQDTQPDQVLPTEVHHAWQYHISFDTDTEILALPNDDFGEIELFRRGRKIIDFHCSKDGEIGTS